MRDRALQELESTFSKQRELWLLTIEDALQNNVSTFAIVPIDVLLNEKTPLNTLRERGYEIDEP
jgi:hypothetical protein